MTRPASRCSPKDTSTSGPVAPAESGWLGGEWGGQAALLSQASLASVKSKQPLADSGDTETAGSSEGTGSPSCPEKSLSETLPH